MKIELGDKELEQIIGGIEMEDDGKLYDIKCTNTKGMKMGGDLVGVEGTAAKDNAIATMTAKGWNCTVVKAY